MKANDIELIEAKYVRLRLLEMLAERRCRVIVEGLVADDGWRAEFLGQSEQGEFALMAHKPFEAPYLVLGVTVDLEGFRRPDDFEEVLQMVSEHDLSVYLPHKDRSLFQLSMRLPLPALLPAEVEFGLGNMLACRERLLERFEGDGTGS